MLILFCIAFAACIVDFETALLLKAFTSLFAYGRSFYQLWLFLAWGIIVSSCFLRSFKKTLNIHPIFFDVSIAALIVLQSTSFADYISSYSLPWLSSSLVVSEGQVSTTSIIHIHNLKSPLALLSSFFSGGFLNNGDNGWPFLTLQSSLYAYLGLFSLFFAIFALGFLAITTFGKEHASLKAPWLLPFIVCSFETLKTCLDGGFFIPGFLFCWLFTSSLLRKPRWLEHETTIVGYKVLFLWVISIVLSSAIMFPLFVALGAIYNVLISFLFYWIIAAVKPFLLTFTLYVVGKSVVQPRIFHGLLLAVLLLPFPSMIMQSPWYTEEFQPSQQVIPSDSTVSLFADRKNYELTTFISEKDEKILEIEKRFKLRPAIQTIQIHDSHCKKTSGALISLDILAKSSRQTTALPIPAWIDSMSILSCSENSWCTHTVKAKLAACVPIERGMHSPLMRYLSAAYYPRFVVLNYLVREQ